MSENPIQITDAAYNVAKNVIFPFSTEDLGIDVALSANLNNEQSKELGIVASPVALPILLSLTSSTFPSLENNT